MASIQRISFKGETSGNLLSAFHVSQFPTPSVYMQTPVAAMKQSSEPTVNSNKKFEANKLVYISSALALASLGFTALYAVRNKKLGSKIKDLSHELNEVVKNSQKISEDVKKVSQTSETLTKTVNEVTEKSKELGEKIEKQKQDLSKDIKDLGHWQDGQIEGVKTELNQKIDGVSSQVGAKSAEFLTSSVEVNHMHLNLISPINGYGKNTQELEQTLRSESTKHIFGIVDRSKIEPLDEITIRVPTSEFKGLSSTGGMSIVPKEIIANLGAIINSKQKVHLVVDTPMYLGQVEENKFYSIVSKQKGKKFLYMSSCDKEPLAQLQRIDRVEIPVYTDKGKSMELVDVYLAKNREQEVDLELVSTWLDKEVREKISGLIKTREPFEYTSGILKVEYNPSKNINKPTATIKYDTVFYKNDKFRMDGPVMEGKTKNIYNNETHEAGETERFMYFDKFFYEYLIKNPESGRNHIGFDLIIGNDWQTGGISAMMKLLTKAKQSFGLDPKIAEKLYNTPIITIMHNAGLAGSVNHSQSKLLNILFGEHSAMIAKNAWMPKNSGLNECSWNGLFHGTNFNPQTMAAAYSDVITPVSKGYGHEMAAHSGFGGDNHHIFRMRAHYNEFSDHEYLKFLARQNGLDDRLVPAQTISYKPITNGCDRVNNVLTNKVARKIEQSLGLKAGSIQSYVEGDISDIYLWHQHNKAVYLKKVLQDLQLAKSGKGNPMNIELPEMTNLDGVTKDTMIVSTAGRIVDQKGLDIFAEAIEEFLSRHKGEENLPVFYAQGKGDQVYIDKLLNVKKRIAERFGQKAADRIVFAKLFSEAGRYDGCKLMSDFTVMSSWFEPCGLVHKEIAGFSGSIPIINKVGGLADGLKDGENAIFSEFKNKYDGENEALKFNRREFANALDRAYQLYKNKQDFKTMLGNSFSSNHSWLNIGGPMEEYAKLLVDLKVLKPEVTHHDLL